jgi:uncharacterized protein (TIGR02596 family)
MLVVLAIVAILAVLSLPAVKGVLGSMDLKGAASITMAQFELARQTASTRNLPVDLRIYTDANTIDPNAGNVAAYRFSAVVIPASASGAAADEFVAAPINLPGDIIYDQTVANFSTLLNTTTSYGDANGNARSVSNEATSAPALVANRPYVKITFLPNGTVSLLPPSGSSSVASGTWCLSLRNLHSAATTSPPAPASNYITLVLDPGTGRARVYQPGYQ